MNDAERKSFQDKVKPVWDGFAKATKSNKKLFNAVMNAKAEFAKK